MNNGNTKLFRLGLFVLTAIAILIAAIFVLLGSGFSEPKSTLETYFRYSISGLDVGSPIKFRGIQVGEVKEILLSSEAYPSNDGDIISNLNSVAVVRMELDLPDDIVNKELSDYVKEGLRTQTELAGITGSLYISLEFLDPAKYPQNRIEYKWKPKYQVIPSAPSLSNEIVENVKNFLAGLDNFDFDKYLGDTIPSLNSLVNNLNRLTSSIDPKTVENIGSNLNTLLSSADNKISEVDVKNLNRLIQQLENATRTFSDSAKKTDTRKLVDSLTALSNKLNNVVTNNQYDIHEIVVNINKIAENLNLLSSELNGDPSALFVPPTTKNENALTTGDQKK